nr:hypothetical protein [Pseudoxanthomonas sp.]
MQIFEVIRWGNDCADPVTGGPNGPDTCFLVRAGTVEEAADLVDARLAMLTHEQVQPWSHAIYLMGEDLASREDARILRGPYIQSAYCHGWRQWHRDEKGEPWQEKTVR